MEKEIKATINGIDIFRWAGTKFPYYIVVKEDEMYRQMYSFKTCKEAKLFVNTVFNK